MSLVKRSSHNPLLDGGQWPYRVNAVFNAGATRLASGETLLLCRVEDCTGKSHLCAARSKDGITDWRIDGQPTLGPEPEGYPEEQWGVEDPRVVWLEELGKFAVAYTCYSSRGPGVSLALTEDFVTFERVGNVLAPENKDAAVLGRRFGGRWAMIHRPVPKSAWAHMWISFSPDLKHWGDHKLIIEARRDGWWDARKIGLCAPAIETPEGWLLIYHGVRETVSGSVYRLGLALLDLEDPTRCLYRGNEWIFTPAENYERVGDVPNVVFPCGYTIGDDGDTINLYYGAGDSSIGLATGSIGEWLDWLKANGTPHGRAD